MSHKKNKIHNKHDNKVIISQDSIGKLDFCEQVDSNEQLDSNEQINIDKDNKIENGKSEDKEYLDRSDEDIS